jgi:choline transport protein
VANFISGLILAIVIGCYPNFEPQHWQQYLLYVCLLWLAAALNIFGIRWLPHFNKLIFVLSVLTLSATTITLFVCGRQNHASASFVFTDVDNGQSGWSNRGFSFLLAVINAVFGFLGTDGGAHLCEEIANPAKNVPRVIVYPLIIGFFTAFPFLCSLLYSITDLSVVLSTPTGLPLLEIYLQATGSKAAAVILTSLFTFCMFGCLVGVGELVLKRRDLSKANFRRNHLVSTTMGDVSR